MRTGKAESEQEDPGWSDLGASCGQDRLHSSYTFLQGEDMARSWGAGGEGGCRGPAGDLRGPGEAGSGVLQMLLCGGHK